MSEQRVVSADSHMMEPAALWQERLDRRFRDRAPEVIEKRRNGRPLHLFVAEGARPFPVAAGFSAGRSGQELRDFMDQGYEGARPSGWDPVERLKDQDLDGVYAEVLYPTLGMPLFGIRDAELQRACFRVYNDWVAEFCSHEPRRLYGIALISLEDVADGVADLEHAAASGMRGAMIWGSPPEERPYSSPEYDPFWAAAAQAGLPISLHLITGHGRETRELGSSSDPGTWYLTAIHEVQRSISTLAFSGVLERHPELRLVSAENDTGWIPHTLYRMDHAYDKYLAGGESALPLKPSEYLRRQLYATFQDDPVGPRTYELFGEDSYMWASDFPHTDSTFPESRQWIEKNFAGVPEHVRRKIVHDNAVRLYRMNFD
ncbi:MAG: amidohydrolase [Proteobacteria bacterium]|nr:amidohydrolase [Pseudomonadota bacterium]